MKGISSTIQEQIDKVLDRFFNQMARQLLGYLPNQGDKSVMISAVPEDSLIHLFVESIGGRKPVPHEEEVLKNLLLTTSNYVESLKSKTKADVLNSLTSAVTDARLREKEASVTDLGEILKEKMGKAQSHFKLIAETEATKFRNTGRFLNIKKVSPTDDPVVVFLVMKNGNVCDECLRIHLLEDGITPRAFRMSQITSDYHKKGTNTPSLCGIHPNCKCSCVVVPQGWGYKNGRISFISKNYDLYKDQNGES